MSSQIDAPAGIRVRDLAKTFWVARHRKGALGALPGMQAIAQIWIFRHLKQVDDPSAGGVWVGGAAGGAIVGRHLSGKRQAGALRA